MRKIKKLTALMLAVVMALAMSITAFATEPEGGNEGDDTQTPPATVTHTYEIYQIFTGTYVNDGTLTDIKWGKNGTQTTGDVVNQSTLDELAEVNGKSDQEKLDVIKKYVNLSSDPFKTGTETSYSVTPGYYLIKDTDESLDGEDEAYTLYVVQVVSDTLSFTPKSDIPKVDKKILETKPAEEEGGEATTEKVDVNEASIGDDVNYEITGTMPSNIDAFRQYKYVFTDTLSKGLTYKKDSIKITIDGTDVTSVLTSKTTVSEYDKDAGTTITVAIDDLKSIKAEGSTESIAITKDTVVTITYTATLNENAEIAGEGNKNSVKLTYSNDPNNTGEGGPTGETPDKEVTTYTTELTIIKTDKDGKFLPGTEFTLSGNGVNVVLVTQETFEVDNDNGTYWKLKDGTYTSTDPTEDGVSADVYESTDTKYKKTTTFVAKGTDKEEIDVVGIVQEDGTVTFKGLGVGEYVLTETKTLPGYNTIESIKFGIAFDATNKTFSVTGAGKDKITLESDNTLQTEIINTKDSLLPSTGGIGTTIFYIVGAILVIGAGVILVVKKRMSNE